MIPRVGHAPEANRRYTARPGTYAILPLKDRFLLTLQVADRLDVQLPGGGIDPGEHPLQALHREVMEEIGWRISRPQKMGVFRRFTYMPDYDLWAEKICHIYVAKPVLQIADPIEEDHETLLLPADQAIDALGNDGDRLFLSRYVSLGSS
ncbi:NUDIX domain-containing protein [Roseobacter litoralis]|uniref:NUDIX hydrolase n=1 Tax=Roseobacter litoralis (strain ATCC 49566 / DSM 6996 / JCM 21268 / NBRC 15278 / OCh 149) TaxID=391595 RepID=F7ZGG8_ROSLO|nr:NUDIX hydrolase [Roseobacter litoralis]AEI96084.1 putative NUDIX hydrolase [Roseobacter litoralis Och 149]